MNAKTNIKSTVERWRLDSAFAQEADQEYRELVLSELLLALDDKSVRQLAKEVGLLPMAIQDNNHQTHN